MEVRSWQSNVQFASTVKEKIAAGIVVGAVSGDANTASKPRDAKPVTAVGYANTTDDVMIAGYATRKTYTGGTG